MIDKYDKLLLIEPLSPEDEFEMIEKYQSTKNEELLEYIVNANLRFVYSLAKQYKEDMPYLSVDDLFSEGTYGLIKAISKFDNHRGFKLISYGVWWIRNYMLRYIDSHNFVKIPRNIRAEKKKIDEFKKIYFNKYGFNPSISMISEELYISCEKISKIFSLSSTSVFSYDNKVTEQDQSVIDTYTEEEDDNMISVERVDMILDKITDIRSRFIMESYFGINTKKLTFKEIGEFLKISPTRAAQINTETILKLRKKNNLNDFDDFDGSVIPKLRKIKSNKKIDDSVISKLSKTEPINKTNEITDEEIDRIIISTKEKLSYKIKEKERKDKEKIIIEEVFETKNFIKRLFNKLF